ncbi:hypothetical protein HELRODRAFT_159671 [Helobdella robusta]|uniref:Laminin-like protein epi-1 n=1 Tax=Helobdella robusta TaxID=6412 RepID=T1EPA7_HELRO|nr:hypothetical protein HELRODRAFT_159671 [Helobdella robusta]ESO13072.1 hypothetical protein HELRODRAFT_159671 [Helobdella robusta]
MYIQQSSSSSSSSSFFSFSTSSSSSSSSLHHRHHHKTILNINIILSCIILLVTIFHSNALDPVVNVARGKPTTAQLTCGFAGPERFISHKYTGVQTSQNVETCYNVSSYPSSNMVDGNDGTWWQSTSRINFIGQGYGVNGKPDAFIELDLKQMFEVQSMSLLFGDSQRPGRMAFYKTTDANTIYQNWFYVVSSSLDCKTYFNVPVLLQANGIQSTPCMLYTAPPSISQKVEYTFTNLVPQAKPWVNVRKIKVEFYQIDLTLGVTAGSNDFQHYTVRSLDVFAKCPCNGQLTDCLLDNTTNEQTCVCGGFTAGKFCEVCQPLYNNKLYAYGTPCEMCNCNNLATSCHFDAVLNTGVCDNCQNFSAGPKCDSCVDNFYKSLTDGRCIPCSCAGDYVKPGGGCYKTASDVIPAGNPNPQPGDCYCMPYIIGPKCDRCQDGAYGLSASGCTDCACLVNGTIGASILCDSAGQCACKTNVMGARCDTCKDGCTACGCDIGGSTSTTCDKTSGQCTCEIGVTGRLCDGPAAGFYYPNLQFLSAELESLDAPWDKTTSGYSGFGYVVPISQIPVSANIDLTSLVSSDLNTFKLMLRCMASAPVNGVLGVGQNNVISTTLNMAIPLTSSWQYVPIGDVTLTKGTVSKITITIPTIVPGTAINLDRIVAIPAEYFNATFLLGQPADASFQSTCMPPANADLGTSNANCLKPLFTLSTFKLNGALPCNCDFTGSTNLTYCEPAGGKCPCKPGVTGRRCDQCDVNFSNLGMAGCLACNCTATTYNMCDPRSGSCLCPPGSQGDRCQTCMLNYYSWNELKGCQPCSCNTIGSTSLSCNVSSGSCSCKYGVTGLKCDQCQDGFWQLTSAGCSPCNCDPGGAVSPTCDKGTGACTCKSNVQGRQCTECKINSFSMFPSLADGCLTCICMGITTICSASYYIPTTIDLTPDLSTIIAVSSSGDPSPAIISVVGDMANMAVPQQSPNIYCISCIAMYSATTLTTPPVQPLQVIVISNKGSQMTFKTLNSNPTIPLPNVPYQMTTNLTVENLVSPTVGVTRASVLLLLNDVKAVLLPAVFASVAHQSSVGSLTYQMQPNLVEKCSCPPGYEGSSCEKCSLGYFRDALTTSDYLGKCIPCQCSAMSNTCDEVTGVCSNCQQNTAGSNCELCQPGFYRNPPSSSGPCLKCPCEGPRVNSTNCEVRNGSVVICTSCSFGYEGDICNKCRADHYGNLATNLMNVCKPCACNGLSTTCDEFGNCLNCTSFTTGSSCEKCVDGKYKDSVTSACVDCNCSYTGSSSNLTCDGVTGQCRCKHGVGWRACDQCLPNYFNFTSNGCLPCECNTLGSASSQCISNGSCLCNPDTEGFKCDVCSVGAFGILNGLPCQKCACDPRGTVNTTQDLATCDRLTGQCNCRPNVVGRNCSMCAPMYSTVPEVLDCQKCDVCSTSLGNDVIAMVNTATSGISSHLTELAQFQQLNQQLISSQLTLSNYCLQLNSCIDASNSYYFFKNGLHIQLNVTAVTRANKIIELNNTANALNLRAGQLNNDTLAELSRMTALKTESDVMGVASNKLNSDLDSHVNKFQTYNMTAANSNQVSSLLLRSNDLTKRANEILAVLLTMETTTNSIKSNILGSRQISLSTDTNILSLNQTVRMVDSQLVSFQNDIISLIGLRTQSNDLYKSYSDIVQSTETLLGITRTNLTNCMLTFTECLNLMHGTWTNQPQISIDSGFQSWSLAYQTVNLILTTVNSSLNNPQSKLLNAEQRADALATQANTISGSFDQVKSKGQPQVDAINKFQSVIVSLQSALDSTKSMNDTLQDVLRYLNAAPITDLQNRVNISTAMANQEKSQIDNLTSSYSDAALNKALDDAATSFQNSVNMWNGLDTPLNNFSSSYTDLMTFILSISPSLNNNYQTGMNRVQEDNASLSALDTANNALRSNVDALNNSINSISIDVTNAYVEESSLKANLTAFKAKLDQVRTLTINSTRTSLDSVNASRPALDARFNNVSNLFKQLQDKLANLEQPVFFQPNTYEQVNNPDINVNDLYNSLGLDFMFPKQKRGVLLFVENTLSNEKLLVQILNGSVCFEYSSAGSRTIVCNYAQLTAGAWYRVYATRYELDIKLTVILLSTGGSVTVSNTSTSSNNLGMVLNSPIYVGGLPLNAANIQKVYDSGIGFNGCIYRVLYNGVTMPIWQSTFRKDSTASCCKKPPQEPQASTITSCVTAYGSGYIAYNPAAPGAFTASSGASLSIQFRTFSPNGVLFLVSSMSTGDFLGVFLQNGKVVFHVSSQMALYSALTDSTYNNGNWYKFTATYSPSSMTLLVERVNASTAQPSETKTATLFNANLLTLNGAIYMVGGQNGTYIRGPVSKSFSGSLMNFQHTTASSGALVPHVWSADVLSSSDVDMNTCLDQVQSGLGFSTPSSYCVIAPGLVPIGTMDISFITSSLSGILLFAPLEQTATSSNTFLYIALFNGDIFIFFDQGQGRQPVFRTRSLMLADNVMHKLSLDFRFVNSPRMKVDNSEAYVGALNMNSNMKLKMNLIYIGGIPPSVWMDNSYLPIRQSFVGGLKEITINPNNAPSYQPVLIKFDDPTYLKLDQCKSVYLGGIQNPLTPVSPPCNPCPSSETTQKCLTPTSVTNNSATNSATTSGYSFGDVSESYVAYSVVGEENVFVQGLVVQLTFKALQPDGLLLYLANQPTSPLTDYFAIYLSKGFVNVVLMNANSLKTVASKKSYYDGEWHSVTTVRVNNFLAILLEDSGDYNNNNVDINSSSSAVSNLFISSPLYAGGLPLSLTSYPTTIPIGKTNFKGCIGNLVVQSYNYKTITFTESKELIKVGVSNCLSGAQLGMYLSTANSYVQVSDSYNANPVYSLVPGFSLILTFKTIATSGVLAVAWDSPNKFVSLSLINGESVAIRAIIT